MHVMQDASKADFVKVIEFQKRVIMQLMRCGGKVRQIDQHDLDIKDPNMLEVKRTAGGWVFTDHTEDLVA